ncbi:MAG TPA: isopentenyl-diphosphate Delta-isomerase [Acidimicrobiales bacterium]|nr:isopentenyl-diphosphate Delta-isomerase [Acidimicrobiales bacterium]
MGERGTVVLVDPSGVVQGEAAKLEAHRPPGRLHLAFSVFLYRDDGRTLLQQRAAAKYHFPLVWANACCSHPGPGEELVRSAEDRVREELGLTTTLTDVASFVYRATCPASGLVEHELDHVLVGLAEGDPVLDPSEVAATRWVDPGDLLSGGAPPGAGALAPWLLPALRLVEAARAAGAPAVR